ncbi:MAG TPA: hypothetical protein VMT68_03345 [Caulobacteraceae bacterium]|nr:hypothetical protein [Caulobacteraceae bacterium]
MQRLLTALRRRGGTDPTSLWNSRSGNIALITAMLMIPLCFALGMAFDFTLAQSRTDQIDGMADVAALGGVTPTMMAQNNATAVNTARTLFLSQVNTISGVTYNSNNVNITANDASSGTSVSRVLTINFQAASQNVFAKLLGMDTFPIHGSSQAKSSTAPNIDFYLLLDTSPSMEIAATSSGITTMQADTPQQESGCAFGCHESAPSDLGTFPNNITCPAAGKYADGTSFSAGSKFPTTGRDNYDLSRCVGVTLRIDLLNQAAQNLMTEAATTATTDHATYRMAMYESDTNQVNTANDLTLYQLQALTSDLTAAKNQAATVAPLEMYQNNHLKSGDSNQDEDTYLDTDLTTINSTYLPTPGAGTNNNGDTPQEVLFIVTDALNDENVSGSRKYLPMDQNGTRCTAIKNRGIRIAVLYTTYEPMTGENWYDSHIAPLQNGTDQMQTAAQNCASPGLFYQVSTNGDVSAALIALFKEAVATARLTQ